MINTCINAYNKEKIHKERELPIENYTEQVEIESEKTFTHEDLQNCLDQLNEKQRIIFNLYAIDLYKPNEIAEILNLSNESVRTDIHRSKQKLKNLLLELKNRREQ
jgi:RNA polymerase sigma-70 factor (ECF subfamily)